MNKIFIFLSSILILFISSSFFIIKEGQCGIVLQFGKVLRNNENKIVTYNPGLHFKFPFLEIVKTLDTRMHTTDNQADYFLTKERKDLIVDSYIKWRINDFSRYYIATGGGDTFQTEVLLKRKFNDRLRSEINSLNLKEIITDLQGKLTTKIINKLNKSIINSNKNTLIDINSTNELGIKIVDIQIKKINLPAKVSNAIYNRMKSERIAASRSQRFHGQEKAEKLRITADYQASVTLAAARKEALIIKSRGESEVMKLFAKNFSKDPYLCWFMYILQAYENSFQSNKNLIFIDADSDFIQYINKIIKIKN